MAKKELIYCPKCYSLRKPSCHHVFPVKFFGRKNNQSILRMCRCCHDEIDAIVMKDIELRREEYLRITKEWLLGKHPVIISREINNESRKEM